MEKQEESLANERVRIIKRKKKRELNDPRSHCLHLTFAAIRVLYI